MTSDWAVVIVILTVLRIESNCRLTLPVLGLLLQLQFTPLYMCVVMYTSYMTCIIKWVGGAPGMSDIIVPMPP